VTRFRLSTRTLFEGCEPCVAGKGLGGPPPCLSNFGWARRDRLRCFRNATNPWPAAGCNKPAGPCAEQTVEVVRNHAGGTCAARRSAVPMGACSRELTHSVRVGGGARESHERRTCREVGPTLEGELRRGGQGHVGRLLRLRSGRPSARESLGDPAGNGKGRGGRGEGKRPATEPTVGEAQCHSVPAAPATLKARSTPRKLPVVASRGDGIPRAPDTLQRRTPQTFQIAG
jgi:hypothetical protein